MDVTVHHRGELLPFPDRVVFPFSVFYVRLSTWELSTFIPLDFLLSLYVFNLFQAFGKGRWAVLALLSLLLFYSHNLCPFLSSILLLSPSSPPPPKPKKRRTESKMFKKLLGKPKKKAPSAISTLEQLHETLEMLEKKENLLQKKIAMEVEKAKDYTKVKNKKAAIQCLKKKKLYEAQVEQLGNFQLRIHDQMILLEGARATTDTIDALRTGSAAVKSINQSLSVDDIDKTMEQVQEQSENMKQIQDALATPVGAAADFDEDELEAELEDLEEAELDEDLVMPTSAVPAVSLPNANLPSRTARESTRSDVDELAALQAEMAL